MRSLHAVLNLFDSIVLVLHDIINEEIFIPSRARADGADDVMMSFEFSFILHFVRVIGKNMRYL